MGLEDMILNGIEKKTHYKEAFAKIAAIAAKLAPLAAMVNEADVLKLLNAGNTLLGNKFTAAQITQIVSVGNEVLAELSAFAKAAEGLK